MFFVVGGDVLILYPQQKGFLASFSTSILMFQVPLSIFCIWLFINTMGSLLLVVVLHGTEIWVDF